MKKKLILLVILVIILMIVGTASVIIINNLENNKQEIDNSQEEDNTPPEINEIYEEFVEVLDNGIKQNISDKFKETKLINGLEISNVDFYLSNGQTIFKAEVTNKSGKDFIFANVNIVLIDKNGNEITKIPAAINSMKNNEKKEIEASTTLDFSNAYDYKIEF